jgi:hypothetical protein
VIESRLNCNSGRILALTASAFASNSVK